MTYTCAADSTVPGQFFTVLHELSGRRANQSRLFMFFWKSQNKQLKCTCALARLADQATMGKVKRPYERRSERRTTFSVGVWVIPMNGAVPAIADIFVALTKDLVARVFRSLPIVFSARQKFAFVSRASPRRHSYGPISATARNWGWDGFNSEWKSPK